MRNLLNFAIVILLFLFFFSLWGFYWAIRPLKLTSSITPADLGVPYENVSFQTKDHILIRAWFIPSPHTNAKTIILLHGYPADKGNILPVMLFLHKEYNLLFFDFRYFGQSEGHYTTAGKEEVLDVLAAMDYLQSKGIHEVGVWGFSLGGAVALMAAAQTPHIKAVVAESSYARLDWMTTEYYPIPLLRYPLGELTRFWAWLFLRYDIRSVGPAQMISKLRIPVLLIHSKQDNVISFRHALLLQQALRQDPRVTTIFYDQGQHGNVLDNHQVIIKKFFDDSLK